MQLKADSEEIRRSQEDVLRKNRELVEQMRVVNAQVATIRVQKDDSDTKMKQMEAMQKLIEAEKIRQTKKEDELKIREQNALEAENRINVNLAKEDSILKREREIEKDRGFIEKQKLLLQDKQDSLVLREKQIEAGESRLRNLMQ